MDVIPTDPGPFSSLATRTLGRVVEWHASLGSTNDRAKALARAGARGGLAVVARAQTAGRGQRGRVWSSPLDTGLYVSFLVRPRIAPRVAPGLTLLSGLAVHEALSLGLGVTTMIKWPNDILVAEGRLRGRKLAGILVEAVADTVHLDHAVVGMGVNLAERLWPKEIEDSGASIEGCMGHAAPAGLVYASIANRLEPLIDEAERDGLGGIFRRVSAALAGLDERVKVRIDGVDTEGVIVGVAEDGALLLRQGLSVHPLYRGELQLSNARPPSLRG